MSEPKDSTGAEILLDVLKDWDTEYVFGCPGTTEVPLLDALVGRETPRFVLATQEGAAVSAADGYARITGKPGVVSLHANVGLANGISHISSAKMAGVPLVVLNAVKPRSLLPHGAFTAAHDHQEMVRQYTKRDWTVLRVEELRQDLNQAFQVALQPPMGPTYLALPQDILEDVLRGRSVYAERPRRRTVSTRPGADALADAASLLADASSPVILSGSGVAVENCLSQVRELAETLGAAVFSENRLSLDYSAYPTNDPHYLGPYVPTNSVIEGADVILALGTKLFVEFQPPAYPWIPEGARLIHHHPDPNEIGKLYPAEVGLCGSVRSTVEELQTTVERRLQGSQDRIAERNARVARLHQDRLSGLRDRFAGLEGKRPMRVIQVVDVLSRLVKDDVTVVSDAVTSNDLLAEYLPRTNAFSYYAGSTGGSLGWGMGAGVGAQLGAPGRKVISIFGDGVFMFGMPALWTAQKYRVPVVFLVINNRSYAAVKAGLLRFKGNASRAGVFPGTDISGVDCAQVARGFGLAAERVEDPDRLGRVLEEALSREEPFFVEALTDPDDVGNLAR